MLFDFCVVGCFIGSCFGCLVGDECFLVEGRVFVLKIGLGLMLNGYMICVWFGNVEFVFVRRIIVMIDWLF